MYVDDAVLSAENEDMLVLMALGGLECRLCILDVNAFKTKVIVVEKEVDSECKVRVDEVALNLSKFVCLRMMIRMMNVRKRDKGLSMIAVRGLYEGTLVLTLLYI